jgi:predicted cupin superfamily sugar epimerase
MDAREIINKLGLIKLPEEGGFYREVYRSPEKVTNSTLQNGQARTCGTDIYYLITPEEFSGLHRVRHSIEIFSFYAGDPAELFQIDAHGSAQTFLLGNNLDQGQTPKHIVPANYWQGTRLIEGGKWALLGCTCIPGFEFEDFEGGTFETLAAKFPQHAEKIKRYTHR